MPPAGRGRGGKFNKPGRGGGKKFSKNLTPLDADGNPVGMWGDAAAAGAKKEDESSEKRNHLKKNHLRTTRTLLKAS